MMGITGLGISLLTGLFLAVISGDRHINGEIKISKETKCSLNTQCLSLNYIPHDIPDNVTRVVLHDVHNVENIKKGTFDGKNWDKVKHLKISKTPGNDQERQRSYPKMEIYQQTTTSIPNGKKQITTMAPLPADKFTQPYKHVQLMEKFIKSIEPYAMEELENLEEFYIESDSFEGLEYGSFTGLDKLKILSFYKCQRLSLKNINKAINGSDTLSNLQTLSMTYINVVPQNGVVLGKNFFTAISTKPLELLDMHKILIKNVKMKYLGGPIMDSLKYIDLSGVTLNQIDYASSVMFKQPRLLDFSSITLPMQLFLFLKFLPLSNRLFPFSLKNTTILTNFESLDFSNIYNSVQPIELHNVTVLLVNPKHEKWHTKNIILRQNNFKYLDFTTKPCVNASYESIDLSINGITFLTPNFCPCCFNLNKLNLSYNKLNEMSKTNYSLFSKIFNFYPNLKELYMTSNELTIIPEEIFEENKMLEIIDFSHNKLEQVRFRLQRLKNLKLLNLQYNRITMLDITSLNNLKLFKSSLSEVLDFRQNPISCSQCDTLQSTQWLATSHFIIHSDQEFVCVNDEGTTVPVDRSSALSVKKLCDRRKRTRNIILQGTLVPLLLIALIIATTCIIKKYRYHKQHKLDMAEKLRLIKEDAMVTKFVVFLCFSSYDDDFARDNVYRPLNQYLQNIVGTDRDLAAYGDQQFRLGKPIYDEMVRCLEASSVIIVILSRTFCTSECCRTEFDYALQMDKPIILMLKEEVNEEEMVPSLRHIFRKNTRILWENQGDGYQLKTSWENVCTSILELVEY